MERLYGAATAPIKVLGMTHECAVCHRYFRAADVEVVDDGAGTIGYACDDCIAAHDRPGKFEGNGGDLAAALVLYAWSLDSGEDDSMSNESWGYCGRFGRWLLIEDDRGFVSAQEYRSVEAASREFQSFYDDGWAAQEDDYYIDGSHYGGYTVAESLGNGLWTSHTFDRLTRARAWFRLKSMRDGYHPNLWLDEGNGIRRIDY